MKKKKENKKKILLVCYRGQDHYFKKMLKGLAADIIVKVTSKKDLSALNDPWDLILCTSEPYEVLNISSNEDQAKSYQFLHEALKLYPDKKIYCLGSLIRKNETIPFILLDHSKKEMRERILNTLN